MSTRNPEPPAAAALKYAFMSFSTPRLSLEETFALATKLGYEGVEPRTERGHAHGIELERTPGERSEIREQAEEAGVEICCLALSTKVSLPDTCAAAASEIGRYVELAFDIGCPRLRIFGGSFPKTVSREAACEAAATVLKAAARPAQMAGVTICLETHDAWTHPEDVARVMREVNHPAIGVNWDVMHPFRTSHVPMQQAFETLRPWLQHVHIHDGTLADPLVLQPMGTGEIDISGALRALRSIGYEGFISGEWIDCDLDLADELRRLRALEAAL